MAISPVGSADTGGTVSADVTITRSWTSTTGTNSSVIVFLPYYNGAGSVVVSSVAWGATNLSRLSGSPGTPTGDDVIGEIWGAVLGASHSSATNNMVVTFSGNVYCDAIIQQFDGVNQSSMSHDGGREATNSSASASISIANCAATDYLIATWAKADGVNACSPSGGATEIYDAVISGLTTYRAVAQYLTGVSGTQAIASTFTAAYHGGGAAALSEASSGPGAGSDSSKVGITDTSTNLILVGVIEETS